ncbi:MAG: LysM peptidoglycan-binding domain-containing protein [Candidatus Obscuribacterales bacterium]|nr:LysM peptidoglycan-binding domain-containing protein [Candidatus Obscuribacterales bacterium]
MVELTESTTTNPTTDNPVAANPSSGASKSTDDTALDAAINQIGTPVFETEQIPELIREVEVCPRAAASIRSDVLSTGSKPLVETPAQAPPSSSYSTNSTKITEEIETPRTDELEALWPGVHHDFLQPVKRTASFFIMLGFIGGAVASLLGVWGYSAVSRQMAINDAGADKPIMVGKQQQKADEQAPLTSKNIDPTSALVPISNTYEVKSGDTLVSIAIKNYRKVTPRLIDQIVESNGLKNANVLNLGQTLNLPTYRPQASTIAATGTDKVN